MVVDYGRYDALMSWKSEAVYDSNTGTWTDGAQVEDVICRATPSGSRELFSDGVKLDYSFDIAFPYTAEILPKAGDSITIKGTTGNEIFKGVLIRIHSGSYSIRAWA